MDLKKFGMPRNQLKIIAILTMICDHATKIFVDKSDSFYYIGRSIIGRISFPIFCVLFVEGYFRTTNKKKHLLTLAILTIVSEPLFDKVLHQAWFYPKKQSVMLTWFVCYIFMIILDKLKTMDFLDEIGLDWPAYILVIGLFSGFSVAVNFDYSLVAILSVCACYFLHQFEKLPLGLSGIAVSLLDGGLVEDSYGALLAIPFILLYNPSLKNKYRMKWLSYSYPVHLAILYVIYGLVRGVW